MFPRLVGSHGGWRSQERGNLVVDPSLSLSPSDCSSPERRGLCKTTRNTQSTANVRHLAASADNKTRCDCVRRLAHESGLH